MRVLTWKSATACSKTWTLDLVGARATSYQLSHSNLTHHITCRSSSYESLPQISFLVMKVVSYGLAQRILVIHGGLTREYPKYPLTQSVGRENLSGESLVSCAPSRFSLEILPPSLLRSGIFTDTHSFAPEYYYNTTWIISPTFRLPAQKFCWRSSDRAKKRGCGGRRRKKKAKTK